VDARQAWRERKVPIADAVTFGNGRMILLEVLHTDEGCTSVRAVAETTLDSFTKHNPDWFAEVVPVVEVPASSHGLIRAGEGSQGGDGFIALSDQADELVYCVFCTSSNPFAKLAFFEDTSRVHAITSNAVEWSFHVDTPWKIETRNLHD
jgi:hypothetical protein